MEEGQHVEHARLARYREPPGDRAPREHRAGAERERLQHVRPAPDPPVDVDLAPARDRLDHLR